MITKLLTFFLILTIVTTNSYASTNDGLKTALDELNYSLTVEWDQKDKDFFHERVETFKQTIEELKRGGLSEEELLEFLNSQIESAAVARDLENTFSLVDVRRMSASELNEHIFETAKKSQQQGASWNGYAVLAQVAVGLVVVGLFVWYVSANSGTPGNAEMELAERKRQQDIKNLQTN